MNATPIAETPTARAETPTARAETPRLRILVVDDEPYVLRALKLQLERSFDVLTAAGGAQGLELLHTHDDIAVVISDMCMPAMDGASFLRLAQKVAPCTARILLTGYVDVAAAVDAVNQGQISSFLLKPCPPGQLAASISAATHVYRRERAQKMLLEQRTRGSLAQIFAQAVRLFACRYAALQLDDDSGTRTLTHGLPEALFATRNPAHGVVGSLWRGDVLTLFATAPTSSVPGLTPGHPAANQLVGVPLFGPTQVQGWMYFADDRHAGVLTPDDVRVAALLAQFCVQAAPAAPQPERT